jgi:L-asparaginase/N4-(beta-N-acetylglucosaminyl)-L-asparaginase
MSDRRTFIKRTALGATLAPALLGCEQAPTQAGPAVRPVALSTWNHGLPANDAAWAVLSQGGSALDAAEAGVRVPEADPAVSTVGYGGLPDRDGAVTLDACIMDHEGRCGSVAFLKNIMHPISVARKVMEETPHVMLVGEGALQFAREQGFSETNLLTPSAEGLWRRWKAESGSEMPPINVENHDTIGMLTLDESGNLAGACTTSGASYKYHGRVGDSPIIGAGLYVDNAVGGATATGWGEAVIRAVGCFLVVEFMRQGHGPEDACRLAVERVIEKNPDWRDIQVGFLALSKSGEYGAYCIAPGFNFAVQTPEGGNQLVDSASRI